MRYYDVHMALWEIQLKWHYIFAANSTSLSLTPQFFLCLPKSKVIEFKEYFAFTSD